MADNSLAIFESITKEFWCDSNGNGFISLRGLARLCGINHNAWGKGGNRITKAIDEKLTDQGLLFEKVVTDGQKQQQAKGVPDTIAAVVIAHYAQTGKTEAQQTLMAFGALGLRTLIQKVAGYKDSGKVYTLDSIIRRTPMNWERMFQQSWIEAAEKLNKRNWNHSLMGHFINNFKREIPLLNEVAGG